MCVCLASYKLNKKVSMFYTFAVYYSTKCLTVITLKSEQYLIITLKPTAYVH